MLKLNKNSIYWYLKNKYEDLKTPCENCTDIDCGKNGVQDFFKKKHKLDVIDSDDCLRQRKKEHEELKQILEHPFFKKQNTDHCDFCRKPYARTKDAKYQYITEPIPNSKSFTLKKACPKCAKKHGR